MSLLNVLKPIKLYQVDSDSGKPFRSLNGSYCEVKKDRHGRKIIVGHRARKNEPESIVKVNANATQGQEQPPEKGVKGVDANKPEEKTSNSLKGQEPKVDQPKDAPFTSEEDRKIKELKAANTPWKHIATTLGRPMYLIKARFKELNKADGNASSAKAKWESAHKNGSEKPAVEGDPARRDWKDMTPSEKKAEGLRKKAARQAAKDGTPKDEDKTDVTKIVVDALKKTSEDVNDLKEGKTARKEKSKKDESSSKQKASEQKKSRSSAKLEATGLNYGSEARFNMNDWIQLQADDIFSFGELRCLSEIIMKCPEQTWGRVAARFFDITGRRIHPLDVRDKFELLAKL